MASPDATFTLEHCVKADVPTLADIGDEAFKADRHTQLKAAHPTTPYVHRDTMPNFFTSMMKRENVEFMKAVDKQSGEILGFCCWFKRFPSPEDKQSKPTKGSGEDGSKVEHADKATEQEAAAEEGLKAAEQAETPKTSEQIRIAREEALEAEIGLTSTHLAAFQKKIMASGAPCMIIYAISVHPKHQGRGIGSALVKYGTAIADEHGAFCWVHSSEAGARNLEKNGFVEVDHLTLDLDDWAEKFGVGPPSTVGENMGISPTEWGPYTLRYFVRRAKGPWGS